VSSKQRAVCKGLWKQWKWGAAGRHDRSTLVCMRLFCRILHGQEEELTSWRDEDSALTSSMLGAAWREAYSYSYCHYCSHRSIFDSLRESWLYDVMCGSITALDSVRSYDLHSSVPEIRVTISYIWYGHIWLDVYLETTVKSLSASFSHYSLCNSLFSR
jgi:hypothetical protein